MAELTLSGVAKALGARHSGGEVRFTAIGTDTRTLRPGDVFIALRGPSFDGHDFGEAAVQAGAAALVVEHELDLPVPQPRSQPTPQPTPQLIVTDTRRALGQLARLWRNQFELPLVAITGSNGKTTVKEMVAAILSQLGSTLHTRGNLNNDIGVPLMLFSLTREHRYAVLELGANHPGEIAHLAALVKPKVAVITNAGPAHLEGFGNVAGVARAKGEIFAALAPEGTAVINLDDAHAPLWKEMAAHCQCVTFGLDLPADVSGAWTQDGSLVITHGGEHTSLSNPLPGRHNASNAVAAAAAAVVLGASLEQVRAGLDAIVGIAGRLQMTAGLQGATLIDDTYNANPASLVAALEVLQAEPGEHWVVLGDMAELGPNAVRLHQEMAERLRQTGVARLFGLGPLTSETVTAFGSGGRHFPSISALLEALLVDLRTAVGPDVNTPNIKAESIKSRDIKILVKGSRSMRMERVVAALSAHQKAPGTVPEIANAPSANRSEVEGGSGD
jgi:UDP-N-acetylmuramoyl-tripeptide--D-alanyl-D-alanine ligase